MRFPSFVNCLANSIDSNYSVTFAVNSIDSFSCRPVISDNPFQDGTARMPEVLQSRNGKPLVSFKC